MREHKSLVVENLNIFYAKKHVIRDISLTLHEGEFTALLGLNGSGKTTLMRGICGLKKPAGGTCTWGGTDILGLNEKKRARLISFIPQRHSVVYDTSVIDVVMMGFNPSMYFFQSPGKKHRLLALETLQSLGIGQLADENFLHLSEGQKQLVILSRALIQNTPVMLMDEPDSALDFVNRSLVLSKIRDIIHERKKCGLITMHDPNFALQYCDRLLLMSDGRIIDELVITRRVYGVSCSEGSPGAIPGDGSIPDVSGTSGAIGFPISGVRDIKEKLSKIYGDIDIIKHNNRYLIVRE